MPINETLFDSMARNMPSPFYLKDLEGKFTVMNAPARQLYEVFEKDVAGFKAQEVMRQDYARMCDFHDTTVAISGEPFEFEQEILSAGRAQTFKTMKFPIIDEFGAVVAVGAVLTDITELCIVQREFTFSENVDKISGLANRSNMERRIANAIAISARSNSKFALTSLSIDHFRKLTAICGSEVGDSLISGLAGRLRGVVGTRGLLGNMHTNEFSILHSPHECPHEIEDLIQQLHEASTDPFEVDGKEFNLSINSGTAIYPDHGETPSDLMRSSAFARSSAKAKGANFHVTYMPQIGTKESRRHAIAEELRSAIARNELTLEYQPKYSMRADDISGCEALLRWCSERLGPISPSVFIPIAIETGQVENIGMWSLRRACEDAINWNSSRKHAPITVAVNIARRQIVDQEFPKKLEDLLVETGMPPDHLELEITNSPRLEETLSHLSHVLFGLKALGVKLSIDVLPTGFMAIDRLRNLPFDNLKINHDFVEEITQQPDGQRLLDAMLSFAKAFGMDLEGEGIETGWQLSQLREIGCRMFQGYHFSQPLPVQEFKMLIGGAE